MSYKIEMKPTFGGRGRTRVTLTVTRLRGAEQRDTTV